MTCDDAFATVADMEALLQIEITSEEQVAAAERALCMATAHIRRYTRQHLSRVEDDVLTLDCRGGLRLFLPELPVDSIAEIKEDDTVTNAGLYVLGQFGMVYRRDGRFWRRGVQMIQITYTHGYAALPDIVVDIATRCAVRMFQAGLSAAANSGLLGISSTRLGDFAVSYAGEQGGGVSEGMMGVSGARPLLLSEQDALDEFRVTNQYRYAP